MNPNPVRVFPLQQAIISRRANSPGQFISEGFNTLQRQGHLLVDRYSRPTSNSIDIRRRSRSSNVLRKHGQQQQQQYMSLDQQSSFNGSNNISGNSINTNNNSLSNYSSNITKKGNTVDSVVQNYINNKTVHNNTNGNTLENLQSGIHNQGNSYQGLSQLKPSSNSHKRTQSNSVVLNSQQYSQHSGIVATMLQQMQNNQSTFSNRNQQGSNVIPRPSQSMLAQAGSPPPSRYSSIASRNAKSKVFEGIMSRLENKDNNDKLPKLEVMLETQQQQYQQNSIFIQSGVAADKPMSMGSNNKSNIINNQIKNLNSVSLQANSLSNLNNQPKQQVITQQVESRFFDGKTEELINTQQDKKQQSFLRINHNSSKSSDYQIPSGPLINTFMDGGQQKVSQQKESQSVDIFANIQNANGKSTNNLFSEQQQPKDISKSKSQDIERKTSKKTIPNSTGISRPSTQQTTLKEYSISNLINIAKNTSNTIQTNSATSNNHLKLAKNNNYIIPQKSQINAPNHPPPLIWNHPSNNSNNTISVVNALSQRISLPFLNIAVQTQPGALPGKPIKTNQDSYIIDTSFSGDNQKALLSVCDGHGANGHFASQYVKKVLCNNIMTFLNSNTQTIKQSLISGFLRTATGLLNSGIDVLFSGSTCVAVYITPQNFWCANLGDSRAILIRETNLNTKNGHNLSSSPFSTSSSYNQKNNQYSKSSWICQALSIDHKPDLPSEKQRILRCNGRVDSYKDNQNNNPVGPARVWLKNENIPGLAMSRSFGDYIASTVGVISEPEVLQFDVSQEDRILVVASDGVWEFLSNKQVMEMIKPFYASNDCQGACEKVVREATAAWKREDDVIDDITVIIAFLNRT